MKLRFIGNFLRTVTLLGLSALVGSALTASRASAAVWDATEQWSDAADLQYTEWVKSNWGVNSFVTKNTPFTGMVLDCADFVYAMRIIFAAEHHLPFAMRDPSGGSKPITQAMTRFDSISNPGKRLRAFLNFIYGTVSTSSLPNDSITVPVNRQWIRAGAFIVTDPKSHHSWTLQNLSVHGIPHLVFASRPARPKGFERSDWPSNEFTFPNGVSKSTRAGVHAFRRPEDALKPEWQVAGYSEEQYAVKNNLWRENLMKKLASSVEPVDQKLSRLLSEACKGALERVDAVNEGLAALAKLPPAACMSAQAYDDFSTPNRDQRLKESLVELETAIAAQKFAEANGTASLGIPAELSARLTAYLASDVSVCPVAASPTVTIALREVLNRLTAKTLSDNPNDPFNQRWGITSGHSTRAASCPTY